jgi:hypothetical protein
VEELSSHRTDEAKKKNEERKEEKLLVFSDEKTEPLDIHVSQLIRNGVFIVHVVEANSHTGN